MKLAEISKILKSNNIKVTKMKTNTQYVLRLSNRSTLIINTTNNEFKDIQVYGDKDKVEETKLILGVE